MLEEWQCLGGPPLYTLYRKSSSKAPKITAFLEFVGESLGAFDPEQITLLQRGPSRAYALRINDRLRSKDTMPIPFDLAGGSENATFRAEMGLDDRALADT